VSAAAAATPASFVFGSNLADRVIVATPEAPNSIQNGGSEASVQQADKSPPPAEGLLFALYEGHIREIRIMMTFSAKTISTATFPVIFLLGRNYEAM
jgi:hypothetical protein